MFDNTNHYKLKHSYLNGENHYFVTFRDSLNILHEIEVSEEVFEEFTRFIRIERNLRRSDERHEEYLELSESELYRRAAVCPESLDEVIAKNEMRESVHAAFQCLTKIQRRRFILRYEHDLTYEQIAEIEGCTKRAVKFTIDGAVEAIKKYCQL